MLFTKNSKAIDRKYAHYETGCYRSSVPIHEIFSCRTEKQFVCFAALMNCKLKASVNTVFIGDPVTGSSHFAGGQTMFRYESRHKAHEVSRQLAATILLLASASALAEQASPSAYQMAVIKDEAYGRVLLSGDYEQGIAKIGSYGSKRAKTFAVKNNLCVAYTLTGKFEDAGPACEAALAICEQYARYDYWPTSPNASRDQALAYSNRGVLRAVTGDFDGARQDFEFAARVDTNRATAAANLAHLKSRQATAVSSL
jgi:tetratricopeptide (TPR) repeat protein